MNKIKGDLTGLAARKFPAPVKELFDDISFAKLAAKAISSATGKPVSIEDSVTQDMLDKVTVFRVLSGVPEKITSIQGIGHFKNLTDFMMEGQFITLLPEDFRGLKHLAIAHFVNCQLKSIPDWIGELSSLRILNLSSQKPLGTMKGTVPESVGELSKLERFDVGNNNNLSGKLPESFARLTLLKDLLVQSNGFEDLTVLNNIAPTASINARNQALGVVDLGDVTPGVSLQIRLARIFEQALTPDDYLFEPLGVEIINGPGSFFDENHKYIHLPTNRAGAWEVKLAFHGRLSNITYKYNVM